MSLINKKNIASSSFKKWLIKLDRSQKTSLVIISDYILLVFSFWISLCIRHNEFYIPPDESITLIFFGPFIAIPIFYFFGLYRSLIRYSNYQSILKLMQAVSLYSSFWFIAVLLVNIVDRPYDFLVINWLVSIFLTGGVRYLARWILSFREINYTNVLIYGAGSSGVQILSALSYSHEIKVIGFIDDNKKLHGNSIEGVKIYGSLDLVNLIKENDITEILLAMPSVSNIEKTKILNNLKKYPIVIRSLPDITDIAQGKVSISDLKKIRIEDLLRRDIRKPISKLLNKEIVNKNILITGAGGSIGSELCRQIINSEPKTIILFDISEIALYSLEKELNATQIDIKIEVILGDILDSSQLNEIIDKFDINTIFHAAAYKHVPLVEKNISAGVKTNIFGTLSCIKAAMNQNVDSFVFISTDKAVRPTNIMGATKRFAEIILQNFAKEQSKIKKTKVSIVRFGNVLGSSGSVVPLFKDQIKSGGPLTITDPNIIRYFMTVSEAAQLVIQAGAMDSDGDIFLLDMGEPVEILTLAKDMIRLSGRTIRDENNPNGEIDIVFTGLRPGEKLYEELLIGDNPASTEHPKIMKASEDFLKVENIDKILAKLSAAKDSSDIESVKKIFRETVDGYRDNED